MDKLLAIAKVTQAAGIKGEVRVKPLTRYFYDYVEEKALYIGLTEQMNREVKLINKKGDGKRVRYHFDGVENRDDAESVVGQFIYASVNEDDKINWVSKDILGATIITDSGDLVGELSDILWLPTNDVYVIKNGDREILIPVIQEIIREIDTESGVIVISPMDGLLD